MYVTEVLLSSYFPCPSTDLFSFPPSVQYLWLLKVNGVGLELDLCVAAETTS